MRVTSKGQVTIPKGIRDRLGIGPGSEVEFVPKTDGSIEIVGADHEDGAKAALLRDIGCWLSQVAGSGDAGLRTDDIMAMTRGADHGDLG